MNELRHVRLLLEPEVWTRARLSLADGDRYLVGSVQWRNGDDCDEALAGQATLKDQIPRGDDFAPLDDLFVIAARRGSQLTARSILSDIRPRPSQTLIVLALDSQDQHLWDGAVAADDVTYPLRGLHVVGAETAADAPDRVGDDVSDEYGFSLGTVAFQRLRRAVSDSVYRKLRRAVVTQVGTARKGALAALHFSGLGIRQLRLCDTQRVGSDSLEEMPGVAHHAIGRFTTRAVAEVLLRQRPEFSVTCCEKSILSSATDSFFSRRTDLIVSCVDNEMERLAAGTQARRLLIPHLDISTTVSGCNLDGSPRVIGKSRLILPAEGCAACLPRPAKSEQDPGIDPDTRAPDLVRDLDLIRSGSLMTINSLTIAAGISAWLDLLSGALRTSLLQRIEWISGEGLSVKTLPVVRDTNCPYCQPRRSLV